MGKKKLKFKLKISRKNGMAVSRAQQVGSISTSLSIYNLSKMAELLITSFSRKTTKLTTEPGFLILPMASVLL